MKKPQSKSPLHLERMLLRMQKYDIVVTWKPGKQMLIAVTLSHACAPAAKAKQTTFVQLNTINNIDLQPKEILDLQNATAHNPILQSLLDTQNGWPDDKSQLPACLYPYWPIQDELSHENGLLLTGERIVVLTACCKAIQDSLHDSAQMGTCTVMSELSL